MLWQHDPSQVIGVWDEIKDDARGLFVKGRLLKDVQKGREAMTLLREGAIDSMSIGYRTIAASDEAGGRVRKLDEVDLFEVSLVTFPMLPEARVAAKADALDEDWRDMAAVFEDARRSLAGR